MPPHDRFVRHLVCECKAVLCPDLQRFQKNTRGTATALLHTIASEIAHISDRIQTQQPDLADALRRSAETFRESLPESPVWKSKDGRFLLHRLLLVLPITQHDVDEENMPLSFSFARMLHTTTVPRHQARRLFTKWAQWASRMLHELASLWRSAPRVRPRQGLLRYGRDSPGCRHTLAHSFLLR